MKMILGILLVILATLLSTIEAQGDLVFPAPRAINDDFRRRSLPPQMRNMPSRDIQRLPQDYVRRRFGDSTARRYRDLSGPCGGIPSQRGRFQRGRLGGRSNFSWDIGIRDPNGRCQLILICPRYHIYRVLWSGPCRDSRRYSQDIMIPRDIGRRREGDCYIQWVYRTRSQTYSNCVDYTFD